MHSGWVSIISFFSNPFLFIIPPFWNFHILLLLLLLLPGTFIIRYPSFTLVSCFLAFFSSREWSDTSIIGLMRMFMSKVNNSEVLAESECDRVNHGWVAVPDSANRPKRWLETFSCKSFHPIHIEIFRYEPIHLYLVTSSSCNQRRSIHCNRPFHRIKTIDRTSSDIQVYRAIFAREKKTKICQVFSPLSKRN